MRGWLSVCVCVCANVFPLTCVKECGGLSNTQNTQILLYYIHIYKSAVYREQTINIRVNAKSVDLRHVGGRGDDKREPCRV